MTEKRKLPGAALAMGFSGVAVAAAVGAVMISSSQPDTKADGATAPTELAAQPSDPDPTLSIQSTPQTPDTPTPGAAPGAIAYSDGNMTFSAALPLREQAGPIADILRKEAEDLLARKKASITEDGRGTIPWEFEIAWKVLGRAGDFVSLEGTLYQFEGGAHGMANTDTRLANMKTGEVIDFPGMLRFGKAFSPAVVIATCEALKKAKLERINETTIMDEPIVCAGPNANVRLEDAKLAIAPSTTADKFGGLYIFFDAYAVGPYAEGSYELAIPHDVFADDLKPQFKALFGGTPKPYKQN